MSWPITDAKTLGWIVRDHRQELDISQEELATRAKVGRQWLVGLEAGNQRNPSFTSVLRVLHELNVGLRAHDGEETERTNRWAAPDHVRLPAQFGDKVGLPPTLTSIDWSRR